LRLRWFFAFFLISGFCGLVDEVVWLRIAMAQFGVVTPLVSTVLSVFMAGLALGSWWGGRLAGGASGRRALSSLRLYAAAELIIATSAFFVPVLLRLGRDQLLRGAADAVWGSLRYHAASGAWIALALLPFCVCMGATFPLAMAAIREAGGEPERRTFGHLYVANVLGATCGTIAAAFVLIELLGFEGTLRAVAQLNVLIGAGALVLSIVRVPARGDAVTSGSAPEDRRPGARGGGSLLTMLFVTGLSSMAMEVVWVRQFTPYLGTVVYAFATILALYLGATFLGSTIYRLGSDPGRLEPGGSVLGLAWAAAGLYGLLTLVATDPRLPFRIVDPAAPQPGDLIVGAVRVALGLAPFCCAMGFITPMLVDRYSAGDPERAGRAYAVNVLGCIVGPLVACFGLLPAMGERWSIAALAGAIFALAPLASARVAAGSSGNAGRARGALAAAMAGALTLGLIVVLATKDYTGEFSTYEVRRDYEATVIATDARGQKELLVNGVGITTLTPITKLMVHLPMSFLGKPPENALVICFGMGTSFRSALSWDVPTTAVELVPSVPELFGFYHPDGPDLLRSPRGRVVIDDGRRFLERSPDRFDIITVDPPPPVEAAGSSLLYSREFYGLARRRLRPGGILQQWFPGGEPAILVSVTKAITDSFPNVRIFRSVEGWGFHFLASERPIPDTPAAVLASRLPARASADLVEWWAGVHPEPVFQSILDHEVPPDLILTALPGIPPLTDDRPFNEYYLLRRTLH
jgi:spermidine synthase